MSVAANDIVRSDTTPAVSERVLIVEDDGAARVGLEQLVKSWGFVAESAVDGEDALAKGDELPARRSSSPIWSCRAWTGSALLRALQSQGADVTTLLLTAQGTVETAVEAMKEGAYDYLTKPVDIQRLKILLDKIVERQETLREVKALRRQLREHGTFGPMIGNSPEMRKIYQVIEQAAPTSASVLITGESGTGKELVAQTIHQLSPRARVSVRRDQLRGDSRDAARERNLRPREGRVHRRRRSAAGLLRAGRSRHAVPRRDRRDDADDAGQAAARAAGAARSGASAAATSRSVDVRVIAATNIDPLEAVQKGKLREDLFYRLNVFAIRLPPLRERKEDLPLLVQAFITEFNARNQKSIAGVDHQAMRMLEQYGWPGNVRELRNVIERATILATGPFIEPRHLPPMLVERAGRRSTSRRWRSAPGTTVEEAERRLIMMTLEHTRDNKTRAAEILGISLKTLHNKLNKLRLRPNKKE